MINGITLIGTHIKMPLSVKYCDNCGKDFNIPKNRLNVYLYNLYMIKDKTAKVIFEIKFSSTERDTIIICEECKRKIIDNES